jgi:URI fold toxin 2
VVSETLDHGRDGSLTKETTGGAAGFTGGASLLATAGVSAGANVVGGIANKQLVQGQELTGKQVAIDATVGAVAGVAGKLIGNALSRGSSSTTTQSIIHGNSSNSQKAQHLYEIFDTSTGSVVKTGISGGKVTANGVSYRATSQVNAWNNAPGATTTYSSRIVQNFPAGPGARQAAQAAEVASANRLRALGQLTDPTKHSRP